MVIHVYVLPVELLARVHLNVTDSLCNGVDKGFMAKRYLIGITVNMKYATRIYLSKPGWTMSHRNIKQAAHGLTKPHWTHITYKKVFMTKHNRLD